MDITKKAKLLKAAICAAGAVCIVIFLSVRIQDAALLLVDQEEYYAGRDLYKESYIEHFRESSEVFEPVRIPLPESYQLSDRNPDINEADILTVGDSYFNFRYLPTYPELLGQRLGRKVSFRRHHDPFAILHEFEYRAEKPRLIIYEMGERGIYRKFTHNPLRADRRLRARQDEKPFFRLMLEPGEAELRYTALLQQGKLTHNAYKWIATAKFDWFGYISPMTPVYSLDPPFLFFKTTVDDSPASFFYRHTEEEMTKICDNIKLMNDKLREDFDLTMVFLPVPSKVTIYSEMVFGDTPYNGFLPRLYEGLRERGIHVIDLYTPFRAGTNQLYFASDTHWNAAGIDLALDVSLDYLTRHNLIDRLRE